MPLPRFCRSASSSLDCWQPPLLLPAAVEGLHLRPKGPTRCIILRGRCNHYRGSSLSLISAANLPWRYGRADARFTVVEYADLEYLPCVLRRAQTLDRPTSRCRLAVASLPLSIMSHGIRRRV